MKKTLENLEDVKEFARDVAEIVARFHLDKARIISLKGDLGAGKTTFSKMFGEVIGVKESIQSPTFVLMKFYDVSFGHFKKMVHIDAYRIESDEEILRLGLAEILKNKENLVLIEWPERIESLIPENTLEIVFTHIDEDTREVHVK